MCYLRTHATFCALLILSLAAEAACDAEPTIWLAPACSSQAGVASEVGLETASVSLSLMQIGPPEITHKKQGVKERVLLGLGRIALPLAIEPAAVQQLDESVDDAAPPRKVHRFSILAAVLVTLTLLGATALCMMYTCCGKSKPKREPLTKDKLLPPVSATAKVPAPPTKLPVGASTGATCCCGDGVGALLRQSPPSQREEKQKPSNLATSTGAAGSLLEHTASQPKATSNDKNTCHPDFSGTWQCVKADGDLDAVLADIGLGMMARTAIQVFGYGAGRVIRIYEQEGDHVKLTEKAIEETVQEWDIDGGEQVIATKEPFLQKTYWDATNPKVLVIEGKDVHKETPRAWTTTRQYFLDGMEDEFVLETTSSGSNVAWWTYERITDA